MAECVNIRLDELEALADFAVDHEIGLTVVGPEAPLCAGVVDVFRRRNLRIFGPAAEAARLEGSKDFAKNFMRKYNIPCADSATFTEPAGAIDYVRRQFAEKQVRGIVIKADGLAAGKGVLVTG